MASMPELGSKISLISKSDIRYEGLLYTVNPDECTIALANVRSYGTEDRETQYAIPPQEEIFNYILFRGSDIKDIRVVNNVQRVPNDPAIMRMELSNKMSQQNFQPQFPLPGMGHDHVAPFPNQSAGIGSGAYNSLSGLGNLGGVPRGQLPPGVPSSSVGPFGQQQQQQQQQQQPHAQQNKTKQASELIHGFPGNNSTSAVEHSNQAQASVLEMIGGGSRSTTPVSLNSRKSPTADMGVQVNQKDSNRRNSNTNRGSTQPSQQQERRDSGRLDGQVPHDNRNQRSNYQHGGNNQNRGNWVRNINQNVRNNQRPRGRGPPQQQAFRQNLNQNNKGGRPKTTIKFESDYDFEQANSKFEELRLSVAKLKVTEEAKPEQVNGEADKKDDSGNETGAGEQEQEEEDVGVGYDKAKSFFDNISCEAATDRKSKKRNDWRHERKINSETFGVSSARRGAYYSNYNRGRAGNYYNNNNRNSQQNFRNAGNTGGYRGGNHFRNQRNFNQRNQHQGQNNQQEHSTTSLPVEKQQNQPSQTAPAAAPAVTAGGSV